MRNKTTALDWDAPQTGIGADCYNVAVTTLFMSRIYCDGYECARHAVSLHRISGMLHRLDEAACNGELTPAQERRVLRLESDADLIAQIYGLHAYHQGDPRGCSLYLLTGEQYKDRHSAYSFPSWSGPNRGHAVVRLGR